jgi:hypothetical protein
MALTAVELALDVIEPDTAPAGDVDAAAIKYANAVTMSGRASVGSQLDGMALEAADDGYLFPVDNRD